MKLRGSTPSPYTRKVRIVAELKGLSRTIEIETADTTDPNDSLRRQNPLGKIPALILPDGQALYDSRVIAEYLDSIGAGPALFPAGAARWPALSAVITPPLDCMIWTTPAKRRARRPAPSLPR